MDLRKTYEIGETLGRQSRPAAAHNVLFLSPSSTINYSKSDLIRYSKVERKAGAFY